jgi:NAD(P)-dependent dehydrogenase (short-subunit alcohol dehydrogenase family)
VNRPAIASDIDGRLALVTGAARGIGLGIATRLGACGARVIATDRDFGALEQAHREGSATLLELDVADDDSSALAPAVLERFGVPELIVNNVGITTPHQFLELGEDDFDHVLRTNLRGPWFLTRGLIDALVRSGRQGNVVFVSSLHDHRIRSNPHYSASKAAVSMLVRELAHELGPYGIRVNAISPGWILRDDQTLHKRYRRRIPLGRPGSPDDVATIAIVLLSNDLSGYVTGANVPVDGGLELHSWLSA